MKKLCPHCGGNQFKAVIKKPGAIQLTDEGAKVLKEIDKVGYEVVECLKCKTKVTNDDLVETLGVPCCECGKVMKEEELINGTCPVCDAKKNRSDLANATPEELIARLLELEKKAGAVQATKIDEKIEIAEQVVESVSNKNEDEEARKRSEAAKKAAATRKANAEKKAREEALAKQNAVAQQATTETVNKEQPVVETPVVEPTIEIDEPNVAPDFSLPDVDASGNIVPPGGINPMEDPF